MKQIVVRLSVHKESILAESGQETLEDAISQELGWLHDSGMFVDGWEFAKQEKEQVKTVEASVDGSKDEALKVYENLLKLQEMPGYRIADTMVFLQNKAEPNEPLTDDEAYVLASKFEEAKGSWFGTTVHFGEHLEALRYLLESGVNETNAPGIPEMTPEDTLKLLLVADDQVFGTLVEAVAVQNAFRYFPYDYQLSKEDLQAVSRAIGRVKHPVKNVSELVSQAAERAEVGVSREDKGFDKVID